MGSELMRSGLRCAAVPGIEHGKRQTYVHHKCRCEPCTAVNGQWDLPTAANRQYLRQYRATNRKAIRASQALYAAKLKESKDVPHGTGYGYSDFGCRCDECRAANTAYARQRRESTVAG